MEDRRARLSHRVGLAGRDAVDGPSFSAAVCAAVDAVLGLDFACLATTDPATSLITGVVKTADTGVGDERFAYYEYEVDDINQFTALAQRTSGTGILVDDTDGDPWRSPRYREWLMPQFGLRHELRVVFRSQGRMWGALGMYRSKRPFTTDDADVLGWVAGSVADGLRATLLRSAVRAEGGSDGSAGPAVIVVDAQDRLVKVTAAATEHLRTLNAEGTSLPTSLLSVIAAARRPAGPPASARLCNPRGQWLLVQAVTLGTSGEVVLTLEPAARSSVAPLALAAFGLTVRELAVAEQVMQGADTASIAKALFLSQHTVQDHLKSIFTKARVRSRRELVATVFAQHRSPL